MRIKPFLSVSMLAVAISSFVTISTPAYSAFPSEIKGQKLPSLAPMLERISPSVVSIAVEGSQISKQRIPESFRFFFGPNMPSEQVKERPFQGLGSGVIIDAKKGYVITNHHVIDSAKKIRIQLKDGREYDASLIGSDEMSDIALLKLDNAKNLTQIKFADSDKLRVGDFAIAIGNPFGLGQTVTSGIISALGRSGLNLDNLENFIQTDAAINSGNSGGALVNLNGDLIGINTAILGPNGGNVGIGFAIPVNMANNLVEQIIEYGKVKRGVLGVLGGELTTDLAKAFDYNTKHGAFVSQVIPNSSADIAGIKAGDIIVSLNGKQIETFGELRAKIATIGAGKKIKLGLIRDGKRKNVIATLKEGSEAKTNAETLHQSLKGAQLENYKKEIEGVQVSAIEPNSQAARSGLKKGDIIIGLNRKKITSLGDLRSIFEQKPAILAINIIRDKTNLYLVIR